MPCKRSCTFTTWTIAGRRPESVRISTNAINVVGTRTPKYRARADGGTSPARSAACVWNGMAEHDDEEHERVRGLFVWEARGEGQCSDAEASPKGDEAEVTGCCLDGAIPMHLERERPDRHE